MQAASRLTSSPAVGRAGAQMLQRRADVVSLTFTVPAYKGPPAPTPAPTATTTTVTTRPHYYEDDRVEI